MMDEQSAAPEAEADVEAVVSEDPKQSEATENTKGQTEDQPADDEEG